MSETAQTEGIARRVREFEDHLEAVDYLRSHREEFIDFDLSSLEGFDDAEMEPGGVCRLRSDIALDAFGAHVEFGRASRSKFEELSTVVRAQNARAAALGLEANLTFRQWVGILRWFEFRCAYCQRADGTVIEHVVPIALGGGTTENNVVPACPGCNARKGHRSPEGWLDRMGLSESFAELCLGGA